MGESSKSWTFKTPILKHAVCPLNIHNFKFKWSFAFRQTENKSEKHLLSPLFQKFEADFLWKVILKILNLGIIPKTHPCFTDCASPAMQNFFPPHLKGYKMHCNLKPGLKLSYVVILSSVELSMKKRLYNIRAIPHYTRPRVWRRDQILTW